MKSLPRPQTVLFTPNVSKENGDDTKLKENQTQPKSRSRPNSRLEQDSIIDELPLQPPPSQQQPSIQQQQQLEQNEKQDQPSSFSSWISLKNSKSAENLLQQQSSQIRPRSTQLLRRTPVLESNEGSRSPSPNQGPRSLTTSPLPLSQGRTKPSRGHMKAKSLDFNSINLKMDENEPKELEEEGETETEILIKQDEDETFEKDELKEKEKEKEDEDEEEKQRKEEIFKTNMRKRVPSLPNVSLEECLTNVEEGGLFTEYPTASFIKDQIEWCLYYKRLNFNEKVNFNYLIVLFIDKS